jgi:hypothetical protein
MGRLLKRVPLDFDYPIGKVWVGYLIKPAYCVNDCDLCKKYAKIKGIEKESDIPNCPRFNDYYLPKNDFEPPKGEGYQLWENTTEGSPKSPVFQTLDELCEWCEKNATTFGSFKASAAEWKEMLNDNFVYHKEGNVMFL